MANRHSTIPQGWLTRPAMFSKAGIKNGVGKRLIDELIPQVDPSWYSQKGFNLYLGPHFIELFCKKAAEELAMPDDTIWSTAIEFRAYVPKPITFKQLSSTDFNDLLRRYDLRGRRNDLFCIVHGKEYLHKDLIPIIKTILHDETPLEKFEAIEPHPCETAGRKPRLCDYEATMR